MQQVRLDIPVAPIYQGGDVAALYWNRGEEGESIDYTPAGRLVPTLLSLLPGLIGEFGVYEGPTFDVPVFGSDHVVGTYIGPTFEWATFDFVPLATYTTRPLYFGDFEFGVSLQDKLGNEQSDPPVESQITVNSWPTAAGGLQHVSNEAPTRAVFSFRPSLELMESN
jgi:hypothetical protein